MRPLGVGLVYLPELDPLFCEGNPDLSVLELEPQTFWEKTYRADASKNIAYVVSRERMARIAALPQHKLVHSVGFPVGGSACYGGDYVTPLNEAVRELSAWWASEHLSFNVIQTESSVEQIGFLLPPRQTRAGITTAVKNIRRLASQLLVPFAFETGVNYLQPRAEEVRDGEFFTTVAEEADCGILLDLHNLWVNERNGRQELADVIDALPLERVWEVHLAGGMMLDGYYLDSHSDAIPASLLDIAAEVIPCLPNLGALIFEMLPGYVPQLGLNAVRQQLSSLSELWQLRRPQRVRVSRRYVSAPESRDGSYEVVHWEQLLGALAVGHLAEDTAVRGELERDKGVAILRTLIGEFRGGRIARAMRFTMTLLLASCGPSAVRQLLRDYQAACYPDIFTSGEAESFANYLRGRLVTLPRVPYLIDVLNFEHALIRAALYGSASRVEWAIDPSELFTALEQGRVPATVREVHVAMDIVPEG